MVGGLFVVGVGSALKQEARECGVLSDAGGSVECAFYDGAWVGVVDHLVPAGLGVGSRVEEGASGADEGFGAGGIETEIAGEAEVGEGVPVVGASGGGGEFEVLGEEFFDGGFVGEDGCSVDVGGGYFGVASEDELGLFEGSGGVAGVARDAGGFDEGGDGVGQVGQGADKALGFDEGGEFGPAVEIVFAGEDVLGIGEGEVGGGDFGEGQLMERGMAVADTFQGFGLGGAVSVEEVFGLFFVLFEVGAGG